MGGWHVRASSRAIGVTPGAYGPSSLSYLGGCADVKVSEAPELDQGGREGDRALATNKARLDAASRTDLASARTLSSRGYDPDPAGGGPKVPARWRVPPPASAAGSAVEGADPRSRARQRRSATPACRFSRVSDPPQVESDQQLKTLAVRSSATSVRRVSTSPPGRARRRISNDLEI
jgi:hypothetical protein